MRNQEWLDNRLSRIWQLFFTEVERKNKIIIKFKGKWKNKFGHIKLLRDKSTEIAINSLFKHEEVPEYMLDLTIAHELVHYMHGFQSPHPRLFKYPHQGGIVNKELKKRGFRDALLLERKVFRKEWPEIYKKIKIEILKKKG